MILGLGLVGLLAGCMLTPVVPNSEGAQAQMAVASPSPPGGVAPSVSPSAGDTLPCDPQSAPFWLDMVGRDWVTLSRCQDSYMQRVGEVPQPIGLRSPDFGITWLAPDGKSAIGTLSRAGKPNVPLIRRWADGRPDEVLVPRFYGLHAVSPNGRMVVYWGDREAGDPDGYTRLVLLRVDDGKRRSVVASGSVTVFMLQWSPDSSRVLFADRAPDDMCEVLAWTGWEDARLHRLAKATTPGVDLMRGRVGWAPDSRHLLLYGQNPMIPNKRASLITIDLEGDEKARVPITDAQGVQLAYFDPRDVAVGNPQVLGFRQLLDTKTGKVVAVADPDIVGWSSEPGKLLRWRMTPQGPELATVRLEEVVP
jgi:dipeptidyl aminopeptidase/acylaminoacyl peptidase